MPSKKNQQSFSNKAEAFEAFDDTPTHDVNAPTIGDVIQQRFGRRDALKGALAITTVAFLMGESAPANAGPAASAFDFEELKAGNDVNHHVADGYEVNILLRWGDALFSDSPEFDPVSQTTASQHRQFGYNNDYIGIFNIADRPDNLLMCVNHEFASPEVMFPGLTASPKDNDFSEITADLVDIEMAAHGISIIELEKRDGKWAPLVTSPLNRRISASNT